jgi:hypothetical protein
MTANDLVCKWSAHCVNNKGVDLRSPTQALMDDLAKQIEKSSKRKSGQFQTVRPPSCHHRSYVSGSELCVCVGVWSPGHVFVRVCVCVCADGGSCRTAMRGMGGGRGWVMAGGEDESCAVVAVRLSHHV